MQSQVQHKVKAGILTVAIFLLLILVLLWIHFHTPIPPYPEGGGGPALGLEVNLGSDNVGMGEDQANELIPEQLNQQAQAQQSKEELLTSEDEESEAIKESSEKPKKTPVKEIPKSKQGKKDQPEKKQQPVLNRKALFPSQANNEGASNTKGNQGNENGVPNSALYTGTGGGSGGGTGGGSGTGTGTDAGSGISFNLEGRTPSFLKKPPYKGQSEGKVVVEITVDKNGKVTSARPGVSGSTILDEDLLQVAKEAALQSKFSPKPDATVQKGRITYHFMLQ